MVMIPTGTRKTKTTRQHISNKKKKRVLDSTFYDLWELVKFLFLSHLLTSTDKAVYNLKKEKEKKKLQIARPWCEACRIMHGIGHFGTFFKKTGNLDRS